MAEFYTTSEVAALLRVKQRKIYDMVAEGALPVRKITGKLLFPRAEIENWLGRHGAVPRHAPAPAADDDVAELPLIAAGGHDPLLEWALRESQSGIAGFFDGALDGLERAEDGDCAFAGLHIPEDDGWNVGAVATEIRATALGPGRMGQTAARPDPAPRPVEAAAKPARHARPALSWPASRHAGSELVLDRLLAAEKMTRADLYFRTPSSVRNSISPPRSPRAAPMSASGSRPPHASSGSISCR